MSKKVAIGELRQIGTLEKNVPVPLGTGYEDAYSDAYITVVKGKLENRSVNKVLDSGAVVFVDSWKWTCRFELAIEADMKKSHRWRIGDKIFMIEGYKLIDEKKRWYEFHLIKSE